MNVRTLCIELVTDAVFTRHSATVGGNPSLGYLPGVVLLGVCAARCYDELGNAALGAFDLGAVRFGMGRPIDASGNGGLPVPLSWHKEKGREQDSRVFDLSAGIRPAKIQLQQLRGMWVSKHPDGTWRSSAVKRNTSMRTAISSSGAAREGFLYSFESLPAGTKFLSRISGQDSGTLSKFVDALTSSPIRVGRSRSAEFGEARVTEVAAVDVGLRSTPASQGKMAFLCVSDLALRDSCTGQPRLWPNASDMGVPGWRLSESASFWRTRRYTPFNAYRRRPDLERQVIEQGSVLVFVREAGAEEHALETVRSRLAGGVGEYRSAGLGEVIVEPEVLGEAEVRLVKTEQIPEDRVTDVPDIIRHHELLGWMKRQSTQLATSDEAWKLGNQWAMKARRWRVSKSQWGVIRALAARSRAQPDPATWLRNEIENTTGKGVSADQWGRHSAELLDDFDKAPRDVVATAVHILARRVVRSEGDNV
jgi:CRISPR-associated protein Csx10